MLYAFKLGPIETGDGFFTTYVGMTPDEAFPPMSANSPTDALRSLAEQANGHDLRCEPSLARAGKTLGFEAAKAPDWVAFPRATLAFGLALGNSGAKLLGAPIPEFLAASAAFMKARPWRHWANGDIVDVRVTGLREKQYETSIMGSGGQEYGIALYEEKGAISKLSRLYDEGRVHEAPNIRSIAVTMDDEPAWAIKAMKEAFGLARLPIPMKVARGAPGPVDAIDLATLATALLAVAQLTPRKTETAARLNVDGPSPTTSGEIVVTASVQLRQNV
jgi:hypothetical protein